MMSEKWKNIVVVSKNDKEWKFSYDEHNWIFTDNTLVIRNEKNSEAKLVLSIDLFAYLEVVEL